MNIAPRAENRGFNTRVRGQAAQSGIDLVGQEGVRHQVDNSEMDDFEALMNADKANSSRESSINGDSYPGSAYHARNEYEPPHRPSTPRSSSGFAGGFGEVPDGSHSRAASSYRDEAPSRPTEPTFRSLEEEKQYYLSKIQRLSSHGARSVSIDTPLDELKYEYTRLKRQQEISASIKFQRRILMAGVTGVEFLNKKFNPFGIKLDGWSESQMDSIEDYDNVFERLHEKYSGSSEVAPEWELMMMLLGSGFMYHLSNTLFRSVLPNVNDIAKQNPDLMQNIANAMSSAMGQQGTAQPGDSMAQMGANLAMQAGRNVIEEEESVTNEDLRAPPGSFGGPDFGAVPSVTPDITQQPMPISSRGDDGISDYGSERDSDASSLLSGVSDLRNISGSKKRGKKGKKDDSRSSMELTL